MSHFLKITFKSPRMYVRCAICFNRTNSSWKLKIPPSFSPGGRYQQQMSFGPSSVCTSTQHLSHSVASQTSETRESLSVWQRTAIPPPFLFLSRRYTTLYPFIWRISARSYLVSFRSTNTGFTVSVSTNVWISTPCVLKPFMLA